MARALAEEAFARIVRDPRDADVERLLAGARALTNSVSDRALEVSVAFREAAVASFRWDIERWRERGEHAHQLCVENCPEQPWLLTNVRMTLCGAWANIGDHRKLREAATAWLADARDRNDRFGQSVLEGLGYGSLCHLMPDQPEAAQNALDAAFAPWPRSPFTFAHLGQFVGMSIIQLYRGGDRALSWMDQEREWLGSAHLLRWSLGRIALLSFEGYAAIAAHCAAPAHRRPRLLETAATRCRQVSKLRWVRAQLHTSLLGAQVSALSGHLGRALEQTRAAREDSERCRSLWQTRSAEYLEGVLEGGDGGRTKREAALRFFADQGWTEPRRAIAVLCPAVDALEAG